LEGHSDADVVLHALCDALLGAAGLPDIGRLYPNTDERFKGAGSIQFLRDVAARLARGGWSVGNADCTLIAERPKISAYSGRMRRAIGEALEVSESRVSIKATTHEGIGALGAGEGIACHAACCIHRAQVFAVE
jgi:2-C-methyl-D-erythritol 2,4-cyclodiphosphate synthase